MLKVLVVDDSFLMRNNIKAYLEHLQHDFLGEAENGKEAVQMCKELQPDLITMDITMPYMDGLTAIEEIRKFDKKVKIVVATSHGQEEVVLKALQAGAKGYILKPVTQSKLAEAIETVFSPENNDEEFLLDD